MTAPTLLEILTAHEPVHEQDWGLYCRCGNDLDPPEPGRYAAHLAEALEEWKP